MRKELLDVNWFNLPNKLKTVLNILDRQGLTEWVEHGPDSEEEPEAYQKEKVVYYNKKLYVSLVDNNTYHVTNPLYWEELTGGGGEVTPVVSEVLVEITHSELLNLVNTNSLVKGQQYRITDYVATVNESVYNEDGVGFFARSNNKSFDIIVTADSVNKLNENARAIRHEGDTYFPSHTKFEAWKLKYTILNDTERFDWADAIMGKGVIYKLIDEWNNDLPYDFKSIQFKRNDVWVYTFGGETDDSLEGQNCYGNKMLNTSTFVNASGYGLNNNTFGKSCHSNIFGNNCHSNTLGNNCHSNTFRSGCYSNTLGIDCYSNTLGIDCYSNTLGISCYSNTFGDNCQSNTFEESCYSNTLGIDCYSNTFSSYCNLNTLGSHCNGNTFGFYYSYFNIDSLLSYKDFTTLLPLFTTTPVNNEIKVTISVNGAVMSQVINATTTESIDI